jgi:hypothetical protein
VHTRDDFGKRERLRDVVVTARRESLDAVVRRVPRRHEQNRCLDAVGAEPARDRDAVDVGQHHVEDDEVGPKLLDEIESSAAVGRGRHREPFVAERGHDCVRYRRFIVDHQHTGAGPAGVRSHRRSHLSSIAP